MFGPSLITEINRSVLKYRKGGHFSRKDRTFERRTVGHLINSNLHHSRNLSVFEWMEVDNFETDFIELTSSELWKASFSEKRKNMEYKYR
ncbi:hypothetical protein TNCV_4907751 [Trichonephila clavipes]|uniref:Uncharacterized protein n=1 Tax=Trichonephila clavipes TaxID=2585209 RepID=A0A8X6V3Q2_TRICX|nr:hypothetical protein TNCV_4907751 [Trichonephila clavipes]